MPVRSSTLADFAHADFAHGQSMLRVDFVGLSFVTASN
jgi:hypothetical protein